MDLVFNEFFSMPSMFVHKSKNQLTKIELRDEEKTVPVRDCLGLDSKLNKKCNLTRYVCVYDDDQTN